MSRPEGDDLLMSAPTVELLHDEEAIDISFLGTEDGITVGGVGIAGFPESAQKALKQAFERHGVVFEPVKLKGMKTASSQIIGFKLPDADPDLVIQLFKEAGFTEQYRTDTIQAALSAQRQSGALSYF